MQGLLSARESQILPRNAFGVEQSNVQSLICCLQKPSDSLSYVDDNDHGAVPVGIYAKEGNQSNLQIDLLFGLSNGCIGNRFASVNVAPRKNPFAVSWLDGPLQQNNSTRRVNDRAGGDLGIEKENKVAFIAYKPGGLRSFQQPRFKLAAASWAEGVFHEAPQSDQ